MTWDNRDVLPSHGAAARAVPGGVSFNRERSPVAPVVFPPCRCDSRGQREGISTHQFPRYQSATITLAASTAFQQVVAFSGRPDNIDIAASAAGVEIRLRNRGQGEADAIRIVNAAFHDTYISRDIVEARDPTGAGGQIVTAHGMWTEPSLAQ